MARILIKSLEKRILFESNDEKLIEMLRGDYPRRIVPSYDFSENVKSFDAIVKYYLADRFEKKYRFPMIEISVEGYSKAEVSFLLLHVFERLYEEDNKYAVECASVEKNGVGILICGDSGSGKTSVTLQLLKLGYNLVSNEVSVIDREKIYGGTDVLNVKEYGLIYVPEEYRDKLIRVDYSKDYHTYILRLPAVKGPIKYNAIFKVSVMPEYEKVKLFELPKGFMSLRFFEQSSSLIRGVIPLNNFRNVADSLDNEELSEKRIRNLFSIDVPSYAIFGDARNVAKKINELYEHDIGK